MHLDVLIIHPPAIYDFRKIPHFPGPTSQISLHTTAQYIQVPQGTLSVADYLDRNGFKVMVDNLGERMLYDEKFDAKSYLRSINSEVYAIEWHWYVHGQGAIEVAKLCKTLHPESLVVMGGLTATIFHEEIIRTFHFIDVVIRGEAEKPFYELLKRYENREKVDDSIPNITFRNNDKIVSTPIMKPSEDLDEFEFTRLDLLEPKNSIYTPGTTPHFSMSICRGCLYNCTTCGGSAYTYRRYFGREKPAFRSPEKLVEDVEKLVEQDVRCIGLLQDPRMAGKSYWEKLFSLLREEDPDVERLAMDIFRPVDEEYVQCLSRTRLPITLNISPDSGSYEVRKHQGRDYTNEQLLETIKLCHKYHIPVTVFFMIGLAKEDFTTIEETWMLWEKLSSLDREAISKGIFRHLEPFIPIAGPIMGHMIQLDPGSLGFDYPEKYGYKILYRTLREHLKILAMPSWHQRFNYETELLNKEAIINLIYKSIEFAIQSREKYGLLNQHEIFLQRLQMNIDKFIKNEIDKIVNSYPEGERRLRLKALKYAFDFILQYFKPIADPYGYGGKLAQIVEKTLEECRIIGSSLF
uniref:Radical SAM protein n=1 Tax=Ignisphaera aggregans TaxID=334771 RepID=A0A7C4D118_9CREN